eukprot:TRINITY_DN73858_c0_g1_i1.p1 TRINITY_DN73858_c0_g1~~TRINITY_DN73858_c0_g1_i1.p1  ORF type:complete len:995 (-),score=205.72 TRINITY_DN73858_c0_g1_i1:64-3048(-)
MAAAKPAGARAGAAPSSFLDTVGQHILSTAGTLEAHIDAEGLVKRLVGEEKPTSRTAQRVLGELKELARRAPGAVVSTQGALQAILRAISKLGPLAEKEDFDAIEPLQDGLQTISFLIGEALPNEDEVAKQRSIGVAELAVAHTSNGKGLLELLNATDISTEYDAMVLLQRIYRRIPEPLDTALLADPLALGRLMQTLQSCQIDYVRNECLGLLILLTTSNVEIQKIVTVQGLVETVFAILDEEDLAAGGKVARDLLLCLTNLTGNVTCQKYIRESEGSSRLIEAMINALTGRRPLSGGDDDGGEEDDAFGGGRVDVSEEARWCCLLLLADAALALAGSGGAAAETSAEDDGGRAKLESMRNQDALLRAGALGLCRHLSDPRISLPAKLKIVDLLEALTPNPQAAKRFQAYQDDSGPLFFVAANVVLAPTTDLQLRNALGRVLGRAVASHPTLQSLVCSSLSPQLDMPEIGVVTPIGRQVVGLLEDAARGRAEPGPLWYALHFAFAMLHGNADVQSVCVSMPVAVPSDAGPPETFLDLVFRAFTAVARACQIHSHSAEEGTHSVNTSPSHPESPAAALVGILKFLAYWMASCPVALVPFALSPVTVPLAVDLAKSGPLCGAFFQVHIEGLSSLLLGLCISAEGNDVDVSSLMALLAQSVGIEAFQEKVERLARSESLQRPPRPLSSFRWYGGRFRAFIRERQRVVQRRMVQLYVAGSVGIGGSALSEDVADHYKQLIRVQDVELREVRKENEHLRSEVEAFMRRALQAKSVALVEKMNAMEKENEALQTEVGQLFQEKEERDARYEEESGRLRAAVCELEQQLQSMAVGYEQVERTSESLARDNAELRAELAVLRQCNGSGGGGSGNDTVNRIVTVERTAANALHAANELRRQRDDLLELLSRVAAMSPEAARLVAPLGQASGLATFPPPSTAACLVSGAAGSDHFQSPSVAAAGASQMSASGGAEHLPTSAAAAAGGAYHQHVAASKAAVATT